MTSSQRMGAVSSAQDAALIDAHVVPRYGALFGRMLLSRVPTAERVQVLDIGCGTGHPSLDLLERLPEGSRVIAIDADPALIDHARLRARGNAGRHIFFSVASAEELKFGDEVFDVVIGNLVLHALPSPERALGEARRVLVDGGLLLLTVALDGSFVELFDMFRELALKHDDAQLAARVERIAGRYPSANVLEAMATTNGFTAVDVTTDDLQLPFSRATEIPSDPMMRFVSLPELSWIAGPGEEGARRLSQAIEALDTYFGHGPLSVGVSAGLLVARA